jgi:hypothetical protein
MAMHQTSAFCWSCDAQTLHQRPGVNHILHLLLSIVTLGLWLIVWLLVSIQVGGWRCSRCGRMKSSIFGTAIATVAVIVILAAIGTCAVL